MLIKDVTYQICFSLTMIFNSSLRKGVFSDIRKVAKVTPIFKSGSRSDANNYRIKDPSQQSVFIRNLERIVHTNIYEYLKTTKALTMSQSAFQKCLSTITSMIDYTEKWYNTINDKQLNFTISLDLKKAFDTISHAILIGKLRKYGSLDIAGTGFNHIPKIGKSTVSQMASIRGLELQLVASRKVHVVASSSL